jgi:hypothetical protein
LYEADCRTDWRQSGNHCIDVGFFLFADNPLALARMASDIIALTSVSLVAVSNRLTKSRYAAELYFSGRRRSSSASIAFFHLVSSVSKSATFSGGTLGCCGVR